MSEIKDRQDAVSDIDPIVAALADDTSAAAAVEGFTEAGEPVEPATAAVTASAAADGEAVADMGGVLETEADLAAQFDAAAEELEEAEVEVMEAGPAEPVLAGTAEPNTAAYADTVVELESSVGDLEADADDDGPLLDGDLEDGIASVFAALHAARQDAEPIEPLGDLEAADGVTFRLLGELDRLWHRAA
jgi:hypothetical protein